MTVPPNILNYCYKNLTKHDDYTFRLLCMQAHHHSTASLLYLLHKLNIRPNL